MSGQERVVRFLSDPANYPHEAGDFTVCETHISRVYLAGGYAYKLKKALKLGFLDYSTLELRRRFAEAEVRLNRRLARDVYLGVVWVRENQGRLRLDIEGTGPGRPIEPLVRMVRLDDRSLLRSLVTRGAAREEHIEQLLARLIPFYREAERPSPSSPYGTPEAVRATIVENLLEARPFAGRLIEEKRYLALRSAQLTFLTLEEERFAKRRDEGYVVDAHGDLRSEHIAYVPHCVVLDAIEFNDRFRIIDVAADLAFLRMDLHFHGAEELGDVLVRRYVEETGDTQLERLLDFYQSYRALVRAKVDGIRQDQPGIDEKERRRISERAKRYFDFALAYASRFARPFLLMVSGPSGSGKSTLARALAERLGAVHLRSDVVRKELAGLDPLARARAEVGGGIYSAEYTERTYAELARRARELLAGGIAVIADATFAKRRHRDLLRESARGVGVPVLLFELQASESVLEERVRRRELSGTDASDAGADVLRAQLEHFEWASPGEAPHRLQAEDPPETLVTRAVAILRRYLREGR